MPVIQLVENYRIGTKVKQRIVVSLGTEIDIPLKLRKKVATAVENKLLGIQPFWNDANVNRLADTIVRQIQNEGKWNSLRNVNQTCNQTTENGMETAEIYVNDVEHGTTRQLGPVLIGHTFWQRLGFENILLNAGFNSQQILTTEISILNRLISGDNEYCITDWIRTSAIGDLLGAQIETYAKDRFYRISDKLLSVKDDIENQLYKNERTYFGGENSLVLYDLTNSYFEGCAHSNPKAQYNGNQKEKRTDCPQIVIALVLDGEGFCRRHFTFNGKMSDVKSLTHILESLAKEFKNEQVPTIIIDRGIGSEENIDLIENQFHFKYIVASRSGEEKSFADTFRTGDFQTLKSDKENEVQIHIEKQEDAHYLLCKSSGRARKEKAMRNQWEGKLESDLNQLKTRILNGKINSPDDVNTAIGRLRERHSKVAHYYQINYQPFQFRYSIENPQLVPQRIQSMLATRKEKALTFETTYLALSKDITEMKQKYSEPFRHIKAMVIEPTLQWFPKEEQLANRQALEGNYVLKTNRKDLSDSDIWNTYVMLTRVEKAFRNLKTDLSLRPNPHQLEDRVDGHIFISILAYHLLHAIEFTLRQKDFHAQWSSIKRVISSHCYTTIMLPTVKGTVIHLRKPGIAEEVHQEIYQALNIDYSTLKKNKIYV